MTMITPSYLGETIEYSSLHACRSTLEDPTAKLGKSPGPTTANRVIQLLNTLYNRSGDIGYEGRNPCENIRRFPEQSRDRFMHPEELPPLWQALAAESDIWRDYFTITLLTGARKTNVAAMKWEDLHLASGSWRIPHTKNDQPVLIHLADKVVEILRRRFTTSNGSPWVFPSSRTDRHIEGIWESWQRITKAAGLTDLRVHDLRRTLGSWMAIAGTSLPVVGKALGHKSQAATAVYARLSMAPVTVAVDQATTALLAAAAPKSRKKAKAK